MDQSEGEGQKAGSEVDGEGNVVEDKNETNVPIDSVTSEAEGGNEVLLERKETSDVSVDSITSQKEENSSLDPNQYSDAVSCIKLHLSIQHLVVVCSKKHLPQPKFELQNTAGPAHLPEFTIACSVGEMTEIATASNKSLCRQLAAQKMLKKIESISSQENKDVKHETSADVIKQHVTLLIKCCSTHKFPQPVYNLVSEEGPPHSRSFTLECKVGNIVEKATSLTKSIAKHLAAAKVLKRLEAEVLRSDLGSRSDEIKEKLGLKLTSSSPKHSDNENDHKTYLKMNQFVVNLQNLCSKRSLPEPNYLLLEEDGPPHSKKFTYECCVGDMTERATASSKVECKHLVAEKLLKKIESLNPGKIETATKSKSENVTGHVPALQQFCSSKKLPQPIFALIHEEGPPHNKSFTFECKVNDVVETAVGSTKAQTKHRVALKVLEKLKKPDTQL